MAKYKRKRVYRLRHNQISNGRPWKESEIEKLKKLSGAIHSKLIAKQLNRSYESIRQKAKREKIKLRCNRND